MFSKLFKPKSEPGFSKLTSQGKYDAVGSNEGDPLTRRGFIGLAAGAAVALANPSFAFAAGNSTEEQELMAAAFITANPGIDLKKISSARNTLEHNARVDNFRIFDDLTSIMFCYSIEKRYEAAGNNQKVKLELARDVHNILIKMRDGVFKHKTNIISIKIQQKSDIFGVFRTKKSLEDFLAKYETPSMVMLDELMGIKNDEKKLFTYYTPIETMTSIFKRNMAAEMAKYPNKYRLLPTSDPKIEVYVTPEQQLGVLDRDGIFICVTAGKMGCVVLKQGTYVVMEKGTNKIVSIAACNNPIFAGGLLDCKPIPC